MGSCVKHEHEHEHEHEHGRLSIDPMDLVGRIDSPSEKINPKEWMILEVHHLVIVEESTSR